MDATQFTAFSVALDGGVATVTMTGPTMGPAFFAELPAVFGALDADESVRAIVLSGGADFSVGLDLKAVTPTFAPLIGGQARARDRVAALAIIREWQASITAVANCRTPVIAAISGWCIGGGIDLAAAADVRLE